MPLPAAIDLTALKQTYSQIKNIRPDIPTNVLSEDAEIIEATFPQITSEFAKVGLTPADALWATQRAWRTARLESPLKFNPEKTIDSTSFLQYVTKDYSTKIVRWQIQDENPEIAPGVLARDLQLIEKAQPVIAASYEKLGWSQTDAHNASLVAWKTARLESPLGPSETIDLQSFIKSTGEIGIMVFTSEPDQAEVFLNSIKIGTTNKEKNQPLRYFPDGKKVTVRFIKVDFIPQDLECFAKGQDTVVCKAELKRKQ